MADLIGNPQRVALATDQDGNPSFITREWIKVLGGLTDQANTAATTAAAAAVAVTNVQLNLTTVSTLAQTSQILAWFSL
jgi:hypothetical protein